MLAEEQGIITENRVRVHKEYQHAQRQHVFGNKRSSFHEVEKDLEDITMEQMTALVNKLKNSSLTTSSLKQLRQGLSQGEGFIQVLLRLDGAFQRLVGLLSGHDAEQQLEAAGCVVNLTTGSHKQCWLVAKATASYLISYLSSSSVELQELSAWAIGNIAGDCDDCRELLRANGCLPVLLAGLQSRKPGVIQSTASAIRNLVSPENCCPEVVGLLPALLVPSMHQEALHQVVLLLFTLTTCSCDDLLCNHRCHDAAILLLEKTAVDNVQVVTPLVRTLANISSTNSRAIQELCARQGPVLTRVIPPLLDHKLNHVRKDTVWWLSNMLVSGYPSSWAILEQCVPLVLPMIDGFTDTGKESLRCTVNVAALPDLSGSPRSLLLQQGVVGRLTPLLRVPEEVILRDLCIIVFLLYQREPAQVVSEVRAADWLPLLERCIAQLSGDVTLRDTLLALVQLCWPVNTSTPCSD